MSLKTFTTVLIDLKKTGIHLKTIRKVIVQRYHLKNKNIEKVCQY